jgi:hypothetical protein
VTDKQGKLPCFFCMPIAKRVLCIIAGGILITLLQFVALLITTKVIVSGRDLFGFGRGLIFIAALAQGVWGLVYSAIMTFINTYRLSIIFSLIVSIWMSSGNVQSAFEIYRRTDYFDREYFIADIFQIIANFAIYPFTAIFIWNLKTKFADPDR